MTVAIPEPRSVAVHERDIVDGWTMMLGPAAELAAQIANTDFVPKALRGKPAAITACILTGREMQIGPMLSLKVIHMVDGQPTLAAEYKRARALEAGHEIVYLEQNTVRCKVRGRRKGSKDWAEVEWSMDDAKRAHLDGKPNYRTYPRRQLEARATGELCDLLFPDCTYGLATLEAVQDGDYGELEDAPSANGAAPPAPAQRTAQRRKPQTPAAGVNSPQSGDQAGTDDLAPLGEPSPPPQDLPPLPGEDDPDTASDVPGSVTGPQLTKIAVLMGELGFGPKERDTKLGIAAKITGRPLTSSKDLSLNEARALIDTIEACDADWDKLSALLDAHAEVTGGGDG